MGGTMHFVQSRGALMPRVGIVLEVIVLFWDFRDFISCNFEVLFDHMFNVVP